MSKPTATIYQNETDVIIIFSKDNEGKFRGSTTSFENDWSDGGACGMSGFDSRKELNEYLKENNYKKKGTVKLGLYCWSKHLVKTLNGKTHGGTATCQLKLNHKSKHIGTVSSGFSTGDVEVKWK